MCSLLDIFFSFLFLTGKMLTMDDRSMTNVRLLAVDRFVSILLKAEKSNIIVEMIQLNSSLTDNFYRHIFVFYSDNRNK